MPASIASFSPAGHLRIQCRRYQSPNASRFAPPITRRHYPEEARVAPTQEARVEVLEVKVQTLEEKVENLETNAGPGRADA